MGNTNNALARVFTQNMLTSFINTGYLPPVSHRILRRYQIDYDTFSNNDEVLSAIYQVIKNHYRYEYYYKNTLINKLLLNVHRQNTTVALTESHVANSIADLIMINGKAVVYEIKTDLDTLDRLDSQLNDYYSVFNHVCIVGGESKEQALLERYCGKPVGIYILSSRNTIHKIQVPQEYSNNLDIHQIFKVLRKREYESILLSLNGVLPSSTPVKYYEACKTAFCQHTIEEIYPLFLEVLKKRAPEKMDYCRLPEAIRCLVYFSGLSKHDIDRLQFFLAQPYITEET